MPSTVLVTQKWSCPNWAAMLRLRTTLEETLKGMSKATSWTFPGWAVKWTFLHRPAPGSPDRPTTLRLVWEAVPAADEEDFADGPLPF